MKKIALLMMLIVLAAPLTAEAHSRKNHDRHSVSVHDGSSFEVEDGELVLTHKDRHSKDRVVITEDGDLSINGDKVKISDSERKLARKLYREAAELEEMAADIAEDAEKIAAVSTKYAVSQVSAVLRSLSGDDEDGDEKKMEAIDAKFEQEIDSIEKLAYKIENQAEKVVDIAEDLQERVPELEELDWFLDD